jgi:hypothetical protein
MIEAINDKFLKNFNFQSSQVVEHLLEKCIFCPESLTVELSAED